MSMDELEVSLAHDRIRDLETENRQLKEDLAAHELALEVLNRDFNWLCTKYPEAMAELEKTSRQRHFASA